MSSLTILIQVGRENGWDDFVSFAEEMLSQLSRMSQRQFRRAPDNSLHHPNPGLGDDVKAVPSTGHSGGSTPAHEMLDCQDLLDVEEGEEGGDSDFDPEYVDKMLAGTPKKKTG